MATNWKDMIHPTTHIESMTDAELIAELLQRATFRGLIVWQKSNYKNNEPDDTDWRWESRHCDPVKVIEEIGPQIREQE